MGSDLGFAHTPHGPLAMLKDQWLNDSPMKNILSYVSDFCSQLHRAHDLARQNFGRAQAKMKCLYDHKNKDRHFKVSDKVLVLLSIPGSALQAHSSGPYMVEHKLSDRDYVIATPDRHQQKRLRHVNTLKPYFDHDVSPAHSSLSLAVPQFNPFGSGDGVAGLLSSLAEESDNALAACIA